MKYDVIVLGGGVIGITTAFYLWDRGLEVAVVERNDLPSEETSFGNGGQISVSHCEPWAHPGAQWQVVKWLMSKDLPVISPLPPAIKSAIIIASLTSAI